MKKALLIGINYNGTNNQLNGCINDVQNIKTILVNNCGYDVTNTRCLTDDPSTSVSRRPTFANIVSSVAWLLSNATAGDTLIFYYSGHGASLTDRSSDETDGCDEVLVPLDYDRAGVITDDWLFANLAAKVPAGVNLWIFTDCCHSGTMFDLRYNCKSSCAPKIPLTGKTYVASSWTDVFGISLERNVKDIPGNVCLFSGCLDNETSADAYNQSACQYQGAFSTCFIDFLKSNLVSEVLPGIGGPRTVFPRGRVKLRNVLKEINARLILRGFKGQDSQLSAGKLVDLERTLDL